jgi:hypothetical protein
MVQGMNRFLELKNFASSPPLLALIDDEALDGVLKDAEGASWLAPDFRISSDGSKKYSTVVFPVT